MRSAEVAERQERAALDALALSFATRYRLFDGLVERNLAALGRVWASDLDSTLAAVFPADSDLQAAVAGYVSFALDIMRRQKAFERELEYPAKTYAQAASEVYLDFEYMTREYLPGLLLSHFLWPHHYRLLRFFRAAFARTMAEAGADRFVEVGTGTGMYTRTLLSMLGQAEGVSYDISPAAAAFARSHLAAFGVGERCDLRLDDVTDVGLEPCPWLVSVEVLEHLEDPVAFLRTLRSGLVSGGRGFLSTALNAPNADHIYLYRSAGEVEAHLEEAGFSVEQSYTATAYPRRSPGIPVPAVAAFVVT